MASFREHNLNEAAFQTIKVPGSAFYLKTADNLKYDVKRSKQVKVGVVTLKKESSGVHSIKVITLDNSVRGKGLGAAVVTALSKHLGEVTSSPDGQTSDAALKMWSRVNGAVKKPANNPLGYIYSIKEEA